MYDQNVLLVVFQRQVYCQQPPAFEPVAPVLPSTEASLRLHCGDVAGVAVRPVTLRDTRRLVRLPDRDLSLQPVLRFSVASSVG